MFRNFATGAVVSGTALTVGLLDYFAEWKAADPLTNRAEDASGIADAIATLHRTSFLQRSDKKPEPVERLMSVWKSWNPAAGFFHFSTKDAPYVDMEQGDAWLADRARDRAVPPPLKSTVHTKAHPLPRGRAAGALEATLRRRRTWRAFGEAPVARTQLATLLRLTFGIQHWVDVGVAGRVMLRSSPSAGARHPLEAYVVVRRVSKLEPGIYHYDPLTHRLECVRRRYRAADAYLPGQPFYRNAAALVFITAIFERTEWKYPFPRAYRTVLLEAGHFAQTFCLAATELELAPFCTAALADSVIERELRIDGVTESVIYACGVGTRPPGLDWAPSPDLTTIPRLLPPTAGHRQRR